MTVGASPIRPYVLAALSCAVLVGISIAIVDRPAASWAHAALRGTAAFVWLTWIVEPLPAIAVLGAAASGIAAATGWRPGRGGRIVIACCIATIIAVTVNREFKFAFGRTWPETWVADNPSWIRNGAYGFSPFHGGPGWASFPSGHMTVITAPMAVLWQRVRRLRWLWAGVVLLVAVGLFGADFHFVGDMIAGTYLGAACAAGTLALYDRLRVDAPSTA